MAGKTEPVMLAEYVDSASSVTRPKQAVSCNRATFHDLDRTFKKWRAMLPIIGNQFGDYQLWLRNFSWLCKLIADNYKGLKF